jgi:hypothetical protein
MNETLDKYKGIDMPDWFQLFLANDYAHLWDSVNKSCSRIDKVCGRIDKVFWLALTSAGGVISGLLLLVLALLGKI